MKTICFVLAALLLATTPTRPASAEDSQVQKPLGTILAVGDIMQCNGFKKRSVAVASLIADELKGLGETPVRLILLGDIAYPSGRSEDFDCFHENWAKVVTAQLRDPSREILPVPGNHEYQHDSAASPYFAYFSQNSAVKEAREQASTQQTVSGNYGWYATRFPDGPAHWLLLGLNSHLPAMPARKAQYDWLRAELSTEADVSARCVLAFWHVPIFSSGAHGHDGIAPSALPKIMDRMKHSYELLYRSGGSIVLNGHDHDYEQFLPHTNEGHLAVDGLRSFVVGTGGNYIPDQKWKRWPDIIDGPMEKKVDGVLRITLYPSSYDWRFVPVAGTPISGERIGHGVCNTRKQLPP